MIRAAIFGFGSLGRALAAALETRRDVVLAWVVDDAPHLTGRRVADIVPGSACDLCVEANLRPNPPGGRTVLFHAATSDPARTTRQVIEALHAGCDVVSAAEWLFHPWLRFGAEARAIDAAARERGLRVLGCGINPGFCFESLPIVLSRTLAAVARIDILRVSNVGGVGPADFAHLGFGLTPEVFAERVEDGSIEGHMGFPESVAALAERLDLPIDAISDALEPTPALRPIALAHRTVEVGEVAGITQTARGTCGGETLVEMVLEMFLDPEAYGRAPREAVRIAGSRALSVTLEPAAAPAPGAAAMMMHAALALDTAAPGLVSLLDLPLGGGRPGRRLVAGPPGRSRGGVAFALDRP